MGYQPKNWSISTGFDFNMEKLAFRTSKTKYTDSCSPSCRQRGVRRPEKFGVGASFAFPVLKVEVRNMDKKLDGVKNERCPPPARSHLVKEKTNG